MKIFTRYILGEVLSHAAIGASLFTFVIFLRDLGRIMDVVVRNSAPLPSVAEIFFLTLPGALTITIPMGVLVGILIGLSRLAADSEVTAIRASGQGAGLFVRVIILFAIVAWLLAMTNSVYLAPKSAAALGQLQQKLQNTQAAYEIQPRVFYEDLPNMVLYVEDTAVGAKAALWKKIFLADVSVPSRPKVTVAQEGVVMPEGQDRIRLHLTNGMQQELDQRNPQNLQTSTFQETDLSFPLRQADKSAKRDLVPVAEMSTAELVWRAQHPEQATAPRPGVRSDDPKAKSRWYWVEFHRRLALPTSCLVLALVGIPLGLSSRKGGKAMGFVLTIVLVFSYYLVSLFGISFGRQGKMPPGVAVWTANFVFLLAGLFLLYRADRAPMEIGSFRGAWARLKERFSPDKMGRPEAISQDEEGAFERSVSRRRFFSARFPLIIDDLILKDFSLYLGLILTTFITLTLVFTFFELLGDIVRNKVPILMLAEYLVQVTPSMIYIIAPLTVLLAVLITFGLMQKSSEVTAMKATGISIYRIVLPVLVISAVLAAGLFFFDQFYIPHANKRQETLRNQIKGKPPQTYLRPDRKWIFGQQNTIYYYEFFDPDQNRFANISLFQFDPQTFQMTRRVFAARAHWEDSLQKWVFEQGWSREFRGVAIENYRTFDVDTFGGVATEQPPYFKKEVKQSSEMNYEELHRYIEDLQQSGFDVVRLKVQLHKKFAYPIITFVMAILAIPFSMSAGRRGALTSVAVAVAIAVIYFVTAGLFEAMGNANQLPAALAAWAPDIIFAAAGGYLVLKVPT